LDKKILTKKELNYVETLYLYCNLEDFPISNDHSTIKYFNMKSYITDTLLNNSKILGVSKGRSWYSLENYRIGIMDYDLAKKANQFNCVIQYEQHHMFTLDKNLSNLDLPFEGSLDKYKIKRIDITKVAKMDIDYTYRHDFISPYLTKRNEQGTIYLGHRNNGNVFRIYDKTKELLTDTKKHPINYKKISLFSQYFGDIENLYTFELELSRVYLKENLGIDNLLDLDKVYSAYNNIVGRIRIFEDTDKNKKLIDQNNRSRINAFLITDFKEYSRVLKKKYKPSQDYAVDRIIKIYDRYLETMGFELNNKNYMELINILLSRRINNSFMNTTIVLEDNDFSKSLKSMKFKHRDMILNMDNELEFLAKKAFGVIPKKSKNKFDKKINKNLILDSNLFNYSIDNSI